VTQLLQVGGKSFGVGGEEKNLCHRCKYLRASKVRVIRGVQHAPWKKFEIWASYIAFPAFWSKN